MTEASYTVFEGTLAVSDTMTIAYSDYRPTTPSSALPIVYLPGLMRTARDFDRVAVRLASERRVVTIDTRGRGKASRSDDPADYAFDEMIADVWALLDHLGIEKLAIAGLALGAFMMWRMAVQKPGRIAGLIANDTGTETVSRVGKSMVALADQDEYVFEDAVAKLRSAAAANFRDFGADDWRAYTAQVYGETRPGFYKRDFHPAILDAWQQTKEAIPSLFDEFASIGAVPVVILRGERSHYLEVEVAERMAAALPEGRVIHVQERAHPLLLDEPASLAAIREVLAIADSRQ